jgi:hypothetical protein
VAHERNGALIDVSRRDLEVAPLAFLNFIEHRLQAQVGNRRLLHADTWQLHLGRHRRSSGISG